MEHAEYDKMSAVEDAHWWYVGLHELILHFTANERARRGSLAILDAGCGTGRLCQLMSGLGNVTGCDVSDRALELSAKRGVKTFPADLNALDVPERSYDVVTSIDVLYHKWIPDDRAVLARFYRALKPGGLLILNLPAYGFLLSTHDTAIHTRERYTRNGAAAKLEAAGFSVEKATYRVSPLFPLIAAYRLIQKLRDPKGEDEAGSDVWMPGRTVNGFFLGLIRLENFFIRNGAGMPFGTSLFILARKPG